MDWRGTRLRMWVCFVISNLCFSGKCLKTELCRAKAVSQCKMKFVGGLVWLFWNGKTSKYPFAGSQRTEIFSCSSYWSSEKIQSLPEPSPEAELPFMPGSGLLFYYPPSLLTHGVSTQETILLQGHWGAPHYVLGAFPSEAVGFPDGAGGLLRGFTWVGMALPCGMDVAIMLFVPGSLLRGSGQSLSRESLLKWLGAGCDRYNAKCQSRRMPESISVRSVSNVQ